MSKEEFAGMTLFELLKWDFENKDENFDLTNFFDALEGTYPFDAIFDRLKIVEKAIGKLDKKLNRLIEALDNLGKIEVSLREWMNG